MSDKEGKKIRPSPRSFFTNLGLDMPWSQKAWLLMRNNWTKIKNFQSCCGNPGEPGC